MIFFKKPAWGGGSFVIQKITLQILLVSIQSGIFNQSHQWNIWKNQPKYESGGFKSCINIVFFHSLLWMCNSQYEAQRWSWLGVAKYQIFETKFYTDLYVTFRKSEQYLWHFATLGHICDISQLWVMFDQKCWFLARNCCMTWFIARVPYGAKSNIAIIFRING